MDYLADKDTQPPGAGWGGGNPAQAFHEEEIPYYPLTLPSPGGRG